MTNGDFAFFTFEPLRSTMTDQLWNEHLIHVDKPGDVPLRRRVFHVVKQVLYSQYDN